jgi:hypothetical protein
MTIWHIGAAACQLNEPVGTEKGPHHTGQFNNPKPTVVEANIRGDLPVTLLRLWRADGTYHMTAVEGRTRTRELLPFVNTAIREFRLTAAVPSFFVCFFSSLFVDIVDMWTTLCAQAPPGGTNSSSEAPAAALAASLR